MPTIISNDEPPVKKSKMGTIDEALQPLEDSRQLSPEHVTPVETKDPVEGILFICIHTRYWTNTGINVYHVIGY